MSRRKVKPLIPIGLLIMSSALLWHNFMRDRFSDSAVGLMIGVSLGMMILGLVRQRKADLECKRR